MEVCELFHGVWVSCSALHGLGNDGQLRSLESAYRLGLTGQLMERRLRCSANREQYGDNSICAGSQAAELISRAWIAFITTHDCQTLPSHRMSWARIRPPSFKNLLPEGPKFQANELNSNSHLPSWTIWLALLRVRTVRSQSSTWIHSG